MDFLYNLKVRVNILHATKPKSIHQWTDSVFMHVVKPSRFLQGAKIESIIAKELQKRISLCLF